MNVTHIWKGGLAGFLASIITTLIMMVKREVGFFIDFNPIKEISNVLHLPDIMYGWYLHYFLGIIFGLIFSILYHRIPGEERFKGCVFGSILWLIVMLTMMPIGGMGFFAMKTGSNIAMFTFVMDLLFGIFLGIIYARLDKI